jgi:hypothetical protein
VVEHRRALVETSCVPRILELEEVKVEMVAEFVAERVEERSERGNFRMYPHKWRARYAKL